MENVNIPGDAVEAKDADLLKPLQDMLRGLNILGPAGDDYGKGGVFGQTPPQSVAIIESGATALTKLYAGIVAAVGGAAVIYGAANKFWVSQSDGVRVALIAGFAAFISALVLALAIIVSFDVRGRAAGARSIYDARGRIAVTFLSAALAAAKPAAAAPAALAMSSNGTSHDDNASLRGSSLDTALQKAVAPLQEGIASVRERVAKADERSAIIALAALCMANPGLEVTAHTHSGMTGTVQGLVLGNDGREQEQVQVNIKDGAGTKSVRPEDVMELQLAT